MNSIKNNCCNPFDKSEPLYPIIMKEALEEISPLFICSSGFFIRTLNPIELQMEMKRMSLSLSRIIMIQGYPCLKLARKCVTIIY